MRRDPARVRLRAGTPDGGTNINALVTSAVDTSELVLASSTAEGIAASPGVRPVSPTRGGSIRMGSAFSRYRHTHWVRSSFDAALLVTVLLWSELNAPGGIGSASAFWMLAFAFCVLALLQIRGAYRPRLRMHVLDDFRMVVTTTALAAMMILSLRMLLVEDPQGAETVRQWVFAIIFLASGRAVIEVAEIRARQRRRAGRLTLIVGAGTVGRLVARRLGQYPELGLQPVGFLDDAPRISDEASSVPVLGGPDDLDDVVSQNEVEHVIVTFSTASHETLLRLIERCERFGISVSFVPRLFEKMKEKVTIESIGSIPLIFVEPTDPKNWQFTMKYTLDRIVAAALLIPLSLVLLATAVAVWVSSGRPILYRQVRVGRDGRPFEILKFRSMRLAEDGPVGQSELLADIAPGGAEGADRTTRVGAILRRTALDELPQLINVVRGEMSLVGPRPERPEFVRIFEEDVHRYSDRHRVKAGITGWAQINGLRGNTSLSERAEWDNYYIDNFSLWLDVKILMSTATALVRFPPG